MEFDNIFNEALETFGESAQMIKTVEELSELSQALCIYHIHLNLLPREHDEKLLEVLKRRVILEMADVRIMLIQMEEVFGSMELEECYDKKLKKLEATIKSF